MASRQREFEQFIRRVRRRLLVVRLIERAGLGILFGCAASLPLLVIALWRSQPALPLTSAGLVVGALAGLLWGILTRPGELEAAMEADRQLDWADLLASALSVAGRSDDPWARAVAFTADSRCRQTLPAAIVLNRFGARAWGGIGLATALVIAFGFLPTYSTPAPAQNRLEFSSGDLLDNPRSHETVGDSLPRAPRRTVVQPEPEDLMNRRSDEENTNASGSKSTKAGRSTDLPSRGQSVASADSRGAGSGHTDAEDAGELPPPRPGTRVASPNATGAPSGGAGKSTLSARGQGSETGTASDESGENSVPPWRSSDWARNVKRAHDALDSGQVPDSYRDVVRGYFERQ